MKKHVHAGIDLVPVLLDSHLVVVRHDSLHIAADTGQSVLLLWFFLVLAGNYDNIQQVILSLCIRVLYLCLFVVKQISNDNI